MTDIKHLSASAAKMYRKCPKSFWYKYISDIDKPDIEEPEHFKVGNAVHEAIENALQDDPEIVHEEQEEILEILREEENKLDYDYESKYSSKVQGCLETASRWLTNVVEVKSVEEEWTMEREGYDWIGYSDLVADVEMGDGILENVIIDWKTGSLNEQWKEEYQGGVYLELHEELKGCYPDAVFFVYLKEEQLNPHERIRDGEVFWNSHENTYWEAVLDEVSRITVAERTEDWEAKPERDKCHFCDYRYHCADSGIGSENLSVENFNLSGVV